MAYTYDPSASRLCLRLRPRRLYGRSCERAGASRTNLITMDGFSRVDGNVRATGDVTIDRIFSGTLTPGQDDVYAPRAIPPSNPRQFSGLEEVRFRTTGGKLPAFDETVVFPLLLLLEQPVPDTGGKLRISGRDDLALAWSRGEPNVQLWLEAYGIDSAVDSHVRCIFESGAGRGTIPKAALAPLGPGSGFEAPDGPSSPDSAWHLRHDAPNCH